MLIYVNGEFHNDEIEPVVVVFSPQDRLDIIGMKPTDNLLISFPEGMTAEEQQAFIEEYKLASHEKAHELEKQGKQFQPTLPGF